MLFTKRAVDVFNPVDSGGAPRGADMGETLVWGTELERVAGGAAVSGGALIFATRAAMNADLTRAANSAAWVVGDPVAANNAIYRKVGAANTGSWVFAGNLPYQVINLAITGTANALIGAADLPVPPTDRAALILFPTPLANTGAVTLAIDGGTALPVVDRNGSPLTEGYFLAGGTAMVVKAGSQYRAFLDNDYAGAMATIVEALAEMNALYLGRKTSFPTLDNSGNALIEGALVSISGQPDPDDDGMYEWRSGAWQSIGVLPTAFWRVETIFVDAGMVASGTVSVSGGYLPGSILVSRNGAALKIGTSPGLGALDDDVDASDGETLVFATGYLVEDDWLHCLIMRPFALASLDAADVPFVPPGGMTATQVQAALEELHTAKVPATRTVSTAGLLTGGDDLSGDLALAVPKASSVEAVAGSNDTKAVTPLGLNAAILAAGVSASLALVSSGAPGAAATLDIALTGGYRRYLLVVDQIEPVTDNQALLFRVATDGVPTFKSGGSDYQQTARRHDTAGGNNDYSGATGNAFFLGQALAQAGSGYGGQLSLDLTPGGASRRGRFDWTMSYVRSGTGVLERVAGSGMMLANGGVTHLRLVFNSGNIAADMVWQLYGYRN